MVSILSSHFFLQSFIRNCLKESKLQRETTPKDCFLLNILLKAFACCYCLLFIAFAYFFCLLFFAYCFWLFCYCWLFLPIGIVYCFLLFLVVFCLLFFAYCLYLLPLLIAFLKTFDNQVLWSHCYAHLLVYLSTRVLIYKWKFGINAMFSVAKL